MKKLLSLLLSVTLVVGLSIPACAVGTTKGEAPPQEEASPIAVVASLDELIKAAENAEEGDKIAVSATITLDGESFTPSKQVTLVRSEGFTNPLLSVSYNGGSIANVTIIESGEQTVPVVIQTLPDACTLLENCKFVGDGNNFSFLVNVFSGNVTLSNCTFTKSVECPLNINEGANVTVESCIFTENNTSSRGGAINNYGTLLVKNTMIVRNVSSLGGGIYNTGNLTLDNCTIADNDCTENERDDIYSTGVLTIYNNSESDGAGLYDAVTGDKVALPMVEKTDLIRLIFLTDEEAKDYFAPPTSSDEGDTLPGDGDDHPAPGDDSTIPDGDGDSEGTIPDKEPDNPEAGENEGEQIPDVVPPTEGGESSQQPEDHTPPTDNDNDGETSDSDQGGAEQPEKPGEDNFDSEDDYIPTRPHKPTQRPSKPSEDNEKPEEDSPAPSLVCGKAVIDASRSVVLAGYGDGDLHEDDPLTRAQLATIIYRLLTNDSIIQYGAGQAVFDDVSTDAWYYQAVNTIGHAGIVSGVGGGRYDPDGLVTWVQAITVLSRFVEPQECELKHITYTGWARPFIETAVSLGWIEDNHEFVPDALIKRGELVSLFNSVLGLYR